MMPLTSPSKLVIEHTMDEGTFINGVARDMDIDETLRSYGLLHSGRRGRWFVPNSEGRVPNRSKLQNLARQLRSYGLEVDGPTIHLEGAYSGEELVADRITELNGRVDKHTDRAARLRASAAAAGAAGEALTDVGQRILKGHHSEKAHTRRIERQSNHFHKQSDLTKAADAEDWMIHSAEVRAGEFLDPGLLQRRIKEKETKLDDAIKLRSSIENNDAVENRSAWLDELEVVIWQVSGEIATYAKYLAALEAEGAVVWRKSDFMPGDLVLAKHDLPYIVRRVNEKSLTVESEGQQSSLAYDKVTGMGRPGRDKKVLRSPKRDGEAELLSTASEIVVPPIPRSVIRPIAPSKPELPEWMDAQLAQMFMQVKVPPGQWGVVALYKQGTFKFQPVDNPSSIDAMMQQMKRRWPDARFGSLVRNSQSTSELIFRPDDRSDQPPYFVRDGSITPDMVHNDNEPELSRNGQYLLPGMPGQLDLW